MQAKKTAKAKTPKVQVQDNLVGLSLQGKLQHNLFEALGEIGKDEKQRNAIVAALKAIEKNAALPLNRSIREEITGPLADALFKHAGIFQKKLKDNTRFNFAYKSKIARDLVLSKEDTPDHVFEPQTTKLFVHLAKKARHAVIGGAYLGDHAVPGAKVLKKNNGVIHCFEPSDEQRSLLVQNAKMNGVGKNIRAINLGLWDKDNVTLELVGDDAFAHAVPLRGKKTAGKITFPATSIEAYAAKNKINQIDLILLDIEGSELPTLKGAEKFLEMPVGKAPNIIFEVHRYYVDWTRGLHNTEIVKYLESLGYHVYSMRDFQSNVPMPGCKIELIKPEKTYLEGPPHGFNMFAFKDPATIKNSMFRIVSDVSPKLLLHKTPKLHAPTEWQKTVKAKKTSKK